MGHWIGAQGQVNLVKDEKMSHFDATNRKPQTQIKSFISFLSETGRRAESLNRVNSSLAEAAGDLWPKKVPTSAVAGAGVKWMYKARCSSA